MKFKIYQPYFRDDQIHLMDPAFEHLDLRSQTPEEALLREHTINLKCQELAKAEGLDVWGMFSWKWKDKLPGLTGEAVNRMVADHPYQDVYYFDPWPQIIYGDGAYNVWEQGAWNHPHMIEICEELFPAIGIDKRYLYYPSGPEISCYANYYLGNAKFWDGWLDLIERYRAVIPMLSPRVRDLHNGPANYGPFPDLWHFPFIHERLFTTYLAINRGTFHIFGYHHEPLTNECFLLSDPNNIENLKSFVKIRSAGGFAKQDLASKWIEEIANSVAVPTLSNTNQTFRGIF
jgi:hypothetical protein